MRRFLEARGYCVSTAGSVEAALQAVAHIKFDLLVCDIGLPDGSGEDLLRKLRKKGCNFPGIALSGYGMDEDVARSKAAGFQIHLTKPVSSEELLRAIDPLLGSRARD